MKREKEWVEERAPAKRPRGILESIGPAFFGSDQPSAEKEGTFHREGNGQK